MAVFTRAVATFAALLTLFATALVVAPLASGANTVAEPVPVAGLFSPEVVVPADGNPVIITANSNTDTATLIFCGNRACDDGTTFTNLGTNVRSPKVELVDGDLPVVAYETNSTMQFITCEDERCNTSTDEGISPNATDVDYFDLAVADGAPGVAMWQRNTGLSFTAPQCDQNVCPTKLVRSLGLGISLQPSLAYSSTAPVIASSAFGEIALSFCADAACNGGLGSAVFVESGGVSPSLAVTSGDLPVVAFEDFEEETLKILFCGSATCSSPTIVTPDPATGVGNTPSLTLDANDLPVVSYYDEANGDLKVLACGDATCSSGNSITTVDSDGDVGRNSHLVLDAEGLPIVAYEDTTNDTVKLLACDNASCIVPPKCNGKTVTVNLALGETPTAGDDVILGTPGPDKIDALEGNDLICALGGKDIIDAGPGNDRVLAGGGLDTVNLGPGDDLARGGKGNDVINGGEGNDKLLGQKGRDTLDGGDGNKDQCKGGAGKKDTAVNCEKTVGVP